MSDTILSCSQLCKQYQDGQRTTPVLHEVDFSMATGDAVAIVGSSGSGKSTLLHLLGGLDRPDSGEVWVGDDAIFKLSARKLARLRNQQLGFVYQFHHLLGEFTAQENVAMPQLIAGVAPKQAMQQAAKLLERVGLSHRLTSRPAEMSGGERQRTAIARALVNQPQVILADEPTGNLDAQTSESVYDLMLELNREHQMALVIVTHDLALAKRFNRVLTMADGHLQPYQGEL